MKLKHAILQVLGRDDLKALTDLIGLDGVDLCSVSGMAAVLSRAHRATPEALVRFPESAVKERLRHLRHAQHGAPQCPGRACSSCGSRRGRLAAMKTAAPILRRADQPRGQGRPS